MRLINRTALLALSFLLLTCLAIAALLLSQRDSDAMADEELAIRLDMDTSDGPCADIDTSSRHEVGQEYGVAICATGLYPGYPPGTISFKVTYDDTIDKAPDVECTGACLDSNPDANGGNTVWGDGLGSDWDCSSMGIAPPRGDLNPASGAGNGEAFITCASLLGPWTLGDDETSGAIAVIEFRALAEGSNVFTVSDGLLGYTDATEMGTCPGVLFPMQCFGGTHVNGAAAVPTAEPPVTGPSPTPPGGEGAPAGQTPAGQTPLPPGATLPPVAATGTAAAVQTAEAGGTPGLTAATRTAAAAQTAVAAKTPGRTATPKPAGDESDEGGSTGTTVGIVVGLIAAAAVVGGAWVGWRRWKAR
ncbi:MAG: hypothetical protein QME71_06940 [Dehalococcoidia bacterium]|nr:hypothetical protein [Dehalococcoidia bacterium]